MKNLLKGYPALVLGALIAAGEAANLTLLHPPSWIHVAVAILIAVGGVLGIHSRVTPVE